MIFKHASRHGSALTKNKSGDGGQKGRGGVVAETDELRDMAAKAGKHPCAVHPFGGTVGSLPQLLRQKARRSRK